MDGRRRFSGVVLVDRRGWVLLQERDEHARIDPDCWGLVGGHVDPGEDVEAAAYRELAEETEIVASRRAACGYSQSSRSTTRRPTAPGT